jgi:CheY-like chemotaxis protein
MKILIVDDDDGDVMITESCLNSNDNRLEVLRAYDGGDALAILEAESTPPDLILLDLNMPGIDGHAALEKIRSSRTHRMTPIVVFTTSGARKDIIRAFENRANAYVQKPGNLSEFREAIRNIQMFWLKTAKLPHLAAHG